MVPNGLRPLFKLLNACDRGEDDGVEILSSKRRGSTRVHTLLLSLPLTAARARDRVEKLFFSVFRVFFLCFSRIFDVSKCISPVLWCRESRLTRELEITEEIREKESEYQKPKNCYPFLFTKLFSHICCPSIRMSKLGVICSRSPSPPSPS